MLYSKKTDVFRNAIIDTIVAEVSVSVGEDRAIIMLECTPKTSWAFTDDRAGIQEQDGRHVPGA
jgi:hypothetical protein